MWKDSTNGKDIDISFCTIKHPTSPESFSNGDRPKLVEKTKQTLDKWNKGLKILADFTHPDGGKLLVLYGESFL